MSMKGFEGIYDNIEDTILFSKGYFYDDDSWVKSQIDRIKRDIINNEQHSILNESELYIMNSIVPVMDLDTINIVDFGCSVAILYIDYFYKLKINRKIIYNGIDTTNITNTNNILYNGENSIISNIPYHNLFFYSYDDINTINTIINNNSYTGIDIFFSRSGIQYINWKIFLCYLCMYITPSVIVLFDVPTVTDIPSYFTLQLFGGFKIPYSFVNENELLYTINDMGYNIDTICNNNNMKKSWFDKLPDKYMATHTKNFVFLKK